MFRVQLHTMRMLTLALVVVAGVVLAPFLAPLVIAAWLADVLKPLVWRLQWKLHGRRRGSAAIIVLLLLILLVPPAGVVAALLAGAHDFIAQLRAALSGQGMSSLESSAASPPWAQPGRCWVRCLCASRWKPYTWPVPTSYSVRGPTGTRNPAHERC